MISRVRLGVTALALAASTLTVNAWADAPAPAPDAVAATPLGLRPTKSLELAQDPPTSSGFAWKLGSVVILGAFGVWAWRKRGPSTITAESSSLRILRRTTIGVRSELLMVEVDGQRLLLGVTPSSIQNLFIAPLVEDETATSALAVLPDPPPRVEMTKRSPAAKVTGRRAAQAQPEADEPVEEQARGLYAIGKRK